MRRNKPIYPSFVEQISTPRVGMLLRAVKLPDTWKPLLKIPDMRGNMLNNALKYKRRKTSSLPALAQAATIEELLDILDQMPSCPQLETGIGFVWVKAP